MYIVSDEAGTRDNGHQTIRLDPKIIKKGQALIGFEGSFRIWQTVMYHDFSALNELELIKNPDFEAIHKKLVVDFIPELIEVIKAGGALKTFESGSNKGAIKGTGLLLGFAGHIFNIQPNFQVACAKNRNFTAIGSGSEFALGFMEALRDEHLEPEELLKKTIQKSSDYYGNIAGISEILTIDF
jgi:hypothetical protein